MLANIDINSKGLYDLIVKYHNTALSSSVYLSVYRDIVESLELELPLLPLPFDIDSDYLSAIFSKDTSKITAETYRLGREIWKRNT